MEFEWDETKAASNLVKHGVAFNDAAAAFQDVFALHIADRTMDCGEERFVMIGMLDGIVYYVAYVEHGERIRVISARRATRPEHRPMIEIDRDREQRLRAVKEMSDEDVMARALADPDAQPWTDEQLASARRVPRAKIIRRTLGLTQEEFSERYHIPLGTLRDWEQGRTEPDQASQAFLQVIAMEPEIVSRALTPRSAA